MVNPNSVKNLKNGTILIEISNKKHVNILLKIKKFYNISVKAYPHKRLDTSRGVVHNVKAKLKKIKCD